MIPDRLWAKSSPDWKSIAEHTIDVVKASEILFSPGTRLATCWGEFFGVNDIKQWYRYLRVACWLHDLGKANDNFLLYLKTKRPQSLRHEHISALLLQLPGVREWLGPLGLAHDVITSLVISHHLKAANESGGCREINQYETLTPRRENYTKVYCDHPDFREVLDLAAADLGLGPPPRLQDEVLRGKAPVHRLSKEVRESLRLLSMTGPTRPNKANLIRAGRAALIVSDAAGSVFGFLPPGALGEWAKKCFDQPVNGDYIREHVLGPVKSKITDFAPRRVQVVAKTLPNRAALLAPCGDGKTLAAWEWAAAQLDAKPRSNVIYLYPSRTASNHGFEKYVSHAPGRDAMLKHGLSEYWLANWKSRKPTERDMKKDEDEKEWEEKLSGMSAWRYSLFSSTVDQFLSFTTNNYASVCLLPLLVDSVVVTDELDAYDGKMWSALLRFLENFKVPVLGITATLGEVRRRQLGGCLDIYTVPYNSELRYTFDKVEAEAAVRRIKAAHGQGRKVLFVVNTVESAQRWAIQLAGVLPRVICWHSRFRLKDRTVIEDRIMKEFVQDGPCVVVATQVCERALDLDADLLVTEVAPTSAMIQRAGRCNRFGKKDGVVLVIDPESARPYSLADLEGADGWLREVCNGKRLSSDDLDRAMAKYPSAPHDVLKCCSFVDDLGYACKDTFRNDGYTVRAVLDREVDEFVRQAKDAPETTPGLIIPVLVSDGGLRDDDRLPAYFWTVPAERYDLFTGYEGIKRGD
jgi:CRISPR-associated endonuclease/helicase Cas3